MVVNPTKTDLTNSTTGNEIATLRTNLEDSAKVAAVAQVEVLDNPNREDDLVGCLSVARNRKC
jgi:hypothetical protein